MVLFSKKCFSTAVTGLIFCIVSTTTLADTTYGIGVAFGTQDVTWTDQESSTKSRQASKITLFVNGKTVYSALDFQLGESSKSAADTWTPYPGETPSTNSPAAYGKINFIVGKRFLSHFSVFGGYHLQVINANYNTPGSSERNIEHSSSGLIFGATYHVPLMLGSYHSSLGFSVSYSNLMAAKYASNPSSLDTDGTYQGYGAKWIFPINNAFTLDLNYIRSKTESDFGGATLDGFSGPLTVNDVTVESSMMTIQGTVVF